MKKSISVIIIALLATTVMVNIAMRGAQANSYYAVVGSPGPDEFCYCIHDGSYLYPNDTFVTLGLQANYDTNNQYSYYWLYWSWQTGVGGNYQHDYWWYNTPQFTYAYDQYGYWSGATGNAPGSPAQDGQWWEWNHDGGMTVSPDAHAISGETYAIFYDPNNPTNMWYIASIPDPVNQLTAQAGPPLYHYAPGE